MYRMGYDLVKSSLLIEIDPKTCVNTADPPKYFYYAGICCIAMRDYDAAIENLIEVLAMPGHVVSAISVAAYKKILILSLLLSGKKFEPPRYILQMIGRIEKSTKKYEEIVTCFEQRDANKLAILLTRLENVLQQDTNLGLAWRLQEALITQQIKTLSRTYITLSLEDIRKSVNLEDIESVKYWLERLSTAG